jgi:hypothetical protein
MVATIKCVEKRLQRVTGRGIRDTYFSSRAKVSKRKSNKNERGFNEGTTSSV